MKATVFVSLLLLAVGCCSQLVVADDGDGEQQVDAAAHQQAHDELVEEAAEQTRQLDFAEQEAKLMKRYAFLLDDRQDDAKSQPPKTVGERFNWLGGLFGFVSRRSLHNDYLRINEELNKRLPDDETPEKNFDKLLAWYLADGKADKQLGEALGQLASLVHLTTPKSQCKVEGEAILRLNLEAIEGASPSSRVANIVRYFIAHRQRECLPVYKQKFNDIVGNLTDDTIAKVKAVFSDQYVATTSLDRPEMFGDLMFSETHIGAGKPFYKARYNFAKHVFDHLHGIALKSKKTNFIENGNQVNQEKLNKLADEHVLKPCRKFVAKFGPEVFGPFQFDLSVGEPAKEDNIDVQFSFGLVRFELCEFLHRASKSFKVDLLESAKDSVKESS